MGNAAVLTKLIIMTIAALVVVTACLIWVLCHNPKHYFKRLIAIIVLEIILLIILLILI